MPAGCSRDDDAVAEYPIGRQFERPQRLNARIFVGWKLREGETVRADRGVSTGGNRAERRQRIGVWKILTEFCLIQRGQAVDGIG